ncbi:MAG TPA: DUF4349 domain-containing protein [Acidimicrobiales bacterium]|nr:DUF4349 domain-containing protein [Acidimicrobiales bacterium]
MRLRRILPALLALLVVVAGCSSGGDDAASEAVSEDSGADVADEGEGSATAGSGGGGGTDAGGGEVADVEPVDLEAVPIAAVDRKIIYVGTTYAVVGDVAAAVREAADAAAVEGGFVFAQDLAGDHGRVILKVPVDRFDAVFDAVVGIGEVEDQHIEAEDVSERFRDLESRQAALATSIDRIRGFLAEASNVDEVSRLESELTRREAEHDVIAGQLRLLQERTTYGTITAEFRVEDPREAALLEEDSGPPGFGEGLGAGWDAAVTLTAAAATALGFVLPFVPLLALAAVAAWWLRRRSPRQVNRAA